MVKEVKGNDTATMILEQSMAQNIKNLEKDIGELKREIRGRDEAIAEKEKRIADLGRPSIGTC